MGMCKFVQIASGFTGAEGDTIYRILSYVIYITYIIVIVLFVFVIDNRNRLTHNRIKQL